MLGVDVSGRKSIIAMNIGPASHNISHNDQRQFSAGTEKPLMTGPSAGPHVAESAQKQRMYGSLISENISCIEAPPVARHGLPKKPLQESEDQ